MGAGGAYGCGGWEDVQAAVDWVQPSLDRGWVFFSDVREWESVAKVAVAEELEDLIIVPAQDHGKAASLVA